MREKIVRVLRDKLTLPEETISSAVKVDLDGKNADVYVVVFPLSKLLGKSPSELAKELKDIISNAFPEFKVEVVGGYVNVRAKDLIREAFESLQTPFEKKDKRVLVEFPSVNPNKPLHIGHLRNLLLGESISRILEEVGYDVVRMDYIDDLGRQIAESFLYFKKFDGKSDGVKFDHFIGLQYPSAHEYAEKHQEEVDRVMVEAERDPKTKAEFREFAERVMKAQYETHFSFFVFHDCAVFESDISELLDEGVSLLKRIGVVNYEEEGEYRGCLTVNVGGVKRVLVRSNGATTYLGKDIIFHLWKFGLIDGIKWKPLFKQPNGKVLWASGGKENKRFNGADISLNIIGIEQELNQKVVHDVLRVLAPNKEHVHVKYSAVRLKEGRFSGRKGNWVGYTADELLETAVKKLMESRGLDRDRALPIAVGAVVFAFLKINRKKEIVFSWDEALSFEGNSGPYLQYSYVRALSVLRRSSHKGIHPFKVPEGSELEEKEAAVPRMVLGLNEVLENAARGYNPNLLADYLLKLAYSFNTFYDAYRILGSEKEEVRLSITSLFKLALEKALPLLLVPLVDRM